MGTDRQQRQLVASNRFMDILLDVDQHGMITVIAADLFGFGRVVFQMDEEEVDDIISLPETGCFLLAGDGYELDKQAVQIVTDGTQVGIEVIQEEL